MSTRTSRSYRLNPIRFKNLRNTDVAHAHKHRAQSASQQQCRPDSVYFDSNALVAELNERGARIVISQHPARALKLKIDHETYKWRHLIENFFCKLKEFKRIALRACKTDQSFQPMIHLAAAVINSR
ncbi:transposase [Acidiphilium multivorum]|uniref:transposase n=1 Tax=Acidiphilium multivorum TaxID=62140 RepID=UPI001F4BFE4C|nr:transposase [Acidiphilium multivorum]